MLDAEVATDHEAANDASEPTPPATPTPPPPPVVEAAPPEKVPSVPRTYTAPPPFVPVAGIPETVRSILPDSVKAARRAQLARDEARLQRARTRSLVYGIWMAAILSMGTLAYIVMH